MIELVRPTPDDAATLAELGARTFAETFVGVSYYTQAIVDGYNAKAFAQDKVRAELADQRARFYLLRVNGTAAGYAKLVERQPADCVKDLHGIYLERIYIAKEYQHGGHGARLLQHIFGEARSLGYTALWLSVWEFNTQAIAFYTKKGFFKAGDWDWPFESGGVRYVDRDWVMAIRL